MFEASARHDALRLRAFSSRRIGTEPSRTKEARQRPRIAAIRGIRAMTRLACGREEASICAARSLLIAESEAALVIARASTGALLEPERGCESRAGPSREITPAANVRAQR